MRVLRTKFEDILGPTTKSTNTSSGTIEAEKNEW